LPHVTHSENGCLGAFKARVFATGTISSFFTTNMPNPLLWVQNSCLGWFHAISLSYVTDSENGCGSIQSTSFCHRNHFFLFRNEHAHSTTLGPKLMFWVVSRNFVAARHPFLERVSGAFKARVFPPEPFLHFSERTCPLHYFRSKTHVLGGFAQFCCHTSPIPKQVSGCMKARVFATGTTSSFFATNMPNPLL
jgi:hypothetical protein